MILVLLDQNHMHSYRWTGDLQDNDIFALGTTLAKREARLMAMSYSYELQAKVFDRMTELEEKLRIMLPELLRQHADALERLEQEQKTARS